MPRKAPKDKLADLKERQAQIAAQIKLLDAREKEQARKNDTRRKVIAGALALEHAQKNPDSAFAGQLSRLLDEYVTRPAERALFPALEGQEEK